MDESGSDTTPEMTATNFNVPSVELCIFQIPPPHNTPGVHPAPSVRTTTMFLLLSVRNLEVQPWPEFLNPNGCL
jgi:hypothetical protein